MDTPKNIFADSIEDVRDQALECFNYCLCSEMQLPRPKLTEKHRSYLSVDETEAIIKDHAVNLGHGYCIGGGSKEELQEKMETLFNAFTARIKSNIMHEGVKLGYLEPIFDPDKNEFDFEVTEKGEAYNEQQFQEYFGISPDDQHDPGADQ
jgi:hypothetical protein